jgi:hypothetical protein
MKYIITESQYKMLMEKEQEVLYIPDISYFGDWETLQQYLERKGNPPYSIGGDLYLSGTPIKSLGNLTSVGGNLDLYNTPIESLGNLTSVGGNLVLYKTPIKSLGNLTSVGGNLDLYRVLVESLGNLTSVGGNLNLRKTLISKIYTEEQIRQIIDVRGEIYM